MRYIFYLNRKYDKQASIFYHVALKSAIESLKAHSTGEKCRSNIGKLMSEYSVSLNRYHLKFQISIHPIHTIFHGRALSFSFIFTTYIFTKITSFNVKQPYLNSSITSPSSSSEMDRPFAITKHRKKVLQEMLIDRHAKPILMVIW